MQNSIIKNKAMPMDHDDTSLSGLSKSGDKTSHANAPARCHDLFASISQTGLLEIQTLGDTKIYATNEIIFHEGTPAKKFFLVLDGNVKLSKLHNDGTETIVRYITPGQVTAAISLIKAREYPVTASAIDQVKLVAWPREVFITAMHSHPQMAINMMGIMAERLFNLQDRYQELYRDQAEFRIAKTLLRLMEQAGKQVQQGILIDFNLSRQNLASYAGTTQYTVSRILNNWKGKGWIASGREKIIIISPQAIDAVGHPL